MFTVTATNRLSIARPAETVSIPWADVTRGLPHALSQHLTVKDAAGHALPFQVTGIVTNGIIAHSELLFQHDFAPGESTATFTVERTPNRITPPFPTKVFARYVPERLDDFAWENDRIAHRTYGPALAAPDIDHRGKEVLVTSGIDVWCKRVAYPVVDRWYNQGDYHRDQGEGMDMYHVGDTRGCGGTGVWDGHRLYVGGNYETWRVIANGPIRAIFELTYGTWDGGGVMISEVKRFTVDAGHNLDRIESTFLFAGNKPVTIGIGIRKNSAGAGEELASLLTTNAAQRWISQWEVQKKNGSLGEAVIIPGPECAGVAEDADNRLILATVKSGEPMRYLVGAGWTGSGQFSTRQDWDAYVAAQAACANSPLEITISK
ncbi:MAG TPA: DUF4861 family protein [Opitutaceae bacterium]|nr:DUF4861 family protein [Opitutaceae bacterium]